MPTLDLDQLRAFAMVAELKSFTAAGVCLGATQSAISLRVGKLEGRIGRRLLARTPRAVSLTPDGIAFLPYARSVIASHDAALAGLAAGGPDERTVLRLAVSDHAAGGQLGTALRGLKTALPAAMLEVTVGLSGEMLGIYDDGDADAAVVRQDSADRRGGAPIYEDPLAWVGSGEGGLPIAGAPVELVALRGPCGVKATMTGALDAAGLPWRFAFLGGSVTALQAAIEAGLGITALGRRQVPPACRPVEPRRGLPSLPPSAVVLHSRLAGAVRNTLIAAFRTAGTA